MDCRKRSLDSILAGNHANAIGFGNGFGGDSSEILRSVGTPEEGVCKLDDGTLAYL